MLALESGDAVFLMAHRQEHEGEAGSYAGSDAESESHSQMNGSQHNNHPVAQEPADSVNYGAQSPVSRACPQAQSAAEERASSLKASPAAPQRVPRSQISRAFHPGGPACGQAERTSAVLSGLSGEDETALSAAEAAGERVAGARHALPRHSMHELPDKGITDRFLL